MRFYQVPKGARFYWKGSRAQSGAYALKCSSLVAYHIGMQRFAVMWPLAAVSDIEEEHDDTLPEQDRIDRAHQQALGMIFFILLLIVTAVVILWYATN
jgi:hypothetical protein